MISIAIRSSTPRVATTPFTSYSSLNDSGLWNFALETFRSLHNSSAKFTIAETMNSLPRSTMHSTMLFYLFSHFVYTQLHLPKTFIMALNGLSSADVSLRNYSSTHPITPRICPLHQRIAAVVNIRQHYCLLLKIKVKVKVKVWTFICRRLQGNRNSRGLQCEMAY